MVDMNLLRKRFKSSWIVSMRTKKLMTKFSGCKYDSKWEIKCELTSKQILLQKHDELLVHLFSTWSFEISLSDGFELFESITLLTDLYNLYKHVTIE